VSDHRHYVPVLKGRAGELDAIARLDPAARAQLTPLFELTDLPTTTSATLREELRTVMAGIRRAWDGPGRVFVDLVRLRSALRTAEGHHYVEVATDLARSMALGVVPVTGPHRDVAFTCAVATAVNRSAHGVGIRLQTADIEPAQTLDQRLLTLLDDLGVAPADSHLMIDLEQLPRRSPARAAASATRALEAVRSLASWHSVTVLSSAFPNSITSIRGEVLLPRNDWRAWRSLITTSSGKRLPAYGDYAVSGPAHPHSPWGSVPNIRYTAAEHWVVVRDGTRHRMEEFHHLAMQIRRSEDAAFRGFEHCDGCETIVACSLRHTHPGNATTWRMVGTCHHLTTVLEQLSTLPGTG
jgi:hypothetical protein